MATTKVGGGGVAQQVPVGTEELQQQQAPAAKKSSTAKKAKGAEASKDIYAVKGGADPFEIGNVRKTRGLGEIANQAAGDTITSQFPLDDLSQISTHGRQGAGFRLDSGSVRLMWVNARRIEESGGNPGFEMSLWLHGEAIQAFKQRMEDQGAVNGQYTFYAADVSGDAGKTTMKRNGQTWSVSSYDAKGTPLVLEEAGKYRIEFNPGEPKTLEGALRIKVLGDDKEATKQLNDLVKKLGLQSVFSPPTPNSLERFKLARFMWQVAPALADQMRWKSADSLDEKMLLDAFAAIGHTEDNSSGLKALMSADLSQPAVAKQVNLAMALLEKNPQQFIQWVKTDSYTSNGILPGSYSYEYSFNSMLTNAGIGPGTEAYNAAVAKAPPTKAEARVAMLFGLLVKTDASAAENLIKRNPDDFKLEDMKAALAKVGIDPEGDRVKNLRFEEVYPGYFTVLDPALPDLLAKEGARYLYSTADNPERVFLMLSGGQKSSFTRFQEGVLIQGMSSSSDFPTGGAQAVFSRLVTQSAIDTGNSEKAKGNSSSYYYGNGKFNNWSGSRPYKVIINREILARTDWWGHTGDEFGRFTNLTADNRAEGIVKKIQNNYSTSNELMFPIGNDPAYIDFVVCENESQKQQLIDKLNKEGITSWNGKSLEEFVRIEQYHFEHPDDVGLAEKLAAQQS